MGKAMLRTLPAWAGQAEAVAGVDSCPGGACGVPVYPDCASIDTEFDAAIDFSVPAGTMAILDWCVAHRKPLVICTTGLSAEQTQRIREAAQSIPVFRSGNMSLGVNLLAALCRKARQTLGEEFDVEIVETHHNRKLDAPSGTANMLFDAINDASPSEMQPVYGRHERAHRREKREIGIHSLRGGTIAGEHAVRFFGEDEEIALTHRAFSKSVFANGAVRAALFLTGKGPGLYDMDDLVSEVL